MTRTRPSFRQWLDATMAEAGIDQLELDRDRHLAQAEVIADEIAEAGAPRPDVGGLVAQARRAYPPPPPPPPPDTVCR